MQPCKMCGTPTDNPIGYCSQACDDAAATAELFGIMGRFLPKEKQLDEAPVEHSEDITLIRACLTVLDAVDKKNAVLVSVALDALRRIEKGEK